jgi:hypothetical protein
MGKKMGTTVKKSAGEGENEKDKNNKIILKMIFN